MEETEYFSFSVALEHLKNRKLVARKGWNGKNMFIFLVPETQVSTLLDIDPDDTDPISAYVKACRKIREDHNLEYVTETSHIIMKTATNEFVIGWLASQTDMLSNDWQIVDSEEFDYK